MEGFHAHSGWFFQGRGGTVRIIKTQDAKDNSPIVAEGEFDAETWASIVASVSLDGETFNRFRDALFFHTAIRF